MRGRSLLVFWAVILPMREVYGQQATGALALVDSLAAWEKPEPTQVHSTTCPGEGLGISHLDAGTDLRKNRIDTASSYHTVPLETILALPWQDLPKRRYDWTPDNVATVAPYEGVPIAVAGFVAGVREEGKEATNCELDSHPWRDWHLWLVLTSDEAVTGNRSRAIVVEVTPRVRARHAEWSLDSLAALRVSRARVRISGWLMFDPDHPDQVGRTRGTIWEIHPVTRIEVLQSP